MSAGVTTWALVNELLEWVAVGLVCGAVFGLLVYFPLALAVQGLYRWHQRRNAHYPDHERFFNEW